MATRAMLLERRRMKSGRTLWEELVEKYYSCVESVRIHHHHVPGIG